MNLAQWKIAVSQLCRLQSAPPGPVGLVELFGPNDGHDPRLIHLPPFPVIGIGDPDHPIGARLDCIVATGQAAEGMVRRILANPRAAAVTTGLLRILPGMESQAALEAESLAYGMLQASSEHLEWLGKGPYPGHGVLRVVTGRSDTVLDILLDTSDGGAIDRGARDDLYEAFQLALLDDSIRRVVLRARGRSFCLGADLAEFGTTRDPALAHLIRSQTLPARLAEQCSGRLEVHVQGACTGAGLELAAWGSRIVAGPDAWFHLPELAMGILPGAGGCVSLTRRIGRQRTAWMILSGKRISARTALDWGLVDEIADNPDGADIF